MLHFGRRCKGCSFPFAHTQASARGYGGETAPILINRIDDVLVARVLSGLNLAAGLFPLSLRPPSQIQRTIMAKTAVLRINQYLAHPVCFIPSNFTVAPQFFEAHPKIWMGFIRKLGAETAREVGLQLCSFCTTESPEANKSW